MISHDDITRFVPQGSFYFIVTNQAPDTIGLHFVCWKMCKNTVTEIFPWSIVCSGHTWDIWQCSGSK